MTSIKWLVAFLLISTSAFGASTASCYDTDCVLMAHMDGTDTSTTFTDDSASAHAITAVDDTQIDTAQKKFGTASGLFDGTSDTLSIPDSTDWDFASSNFTIDFWVRFNVATGAQTFIDRDDTSTYAVRVTPANNLIFDINGSPTVTYAWTRAADTWYHIAAVRSGSSTYLFLDGVQVGSTGTNSTNINSAGAIYLGGLTSPSFFLNGWLDEFRITKGTAIWTSGFTPPATPYTDCNALSTRIIIM